MVIFLEWKHTSHQQSYEEHFFQFICGCNAESFNQQRRGELNLEISFLEKIFEEIFAGERKHCFLMQYHSHLHATDNGLWKFIFWYLLAKLSSQVFLDDVLNDNLLFESSSRFYSDRFRKKALKNYLVHSRLIEKYYYWCPIE